MQNVKNTMIDQMLSLVAPHLCCGCGQVGKTLCDSCKYDIINESCSACIVCREPESRGICVKHGTSFQRAWFVGERKSVLQRLIGNLKFQNVKAAALPLAELLDGSLPVLPDDVVIVPVPTAPSHIRERGYDHLDIIAKHFASRRGLKLSQLLKRVDNSTQHQASRAKRFEQVKSAFKIDGTVDPELIYIILDDIITTGATINQAANLLRDAGARTIWVVAIARQPLD